MKENCSENVIDGANHALIFSVLLRCVRARETKNNTVRFEERMKLTIIEFSIMIALKRFNINMKLSLHISIKLFKYSKHIRFEFEREGP